MKNSNANLIRKLVNNSWNEPPVTREQAIEIIAKVFEQNETQVISEKE